MRSFLLMLFVMLVCSISLAQEAAPPPAGATEGVQLTVYNDNLAVVKDRRRMTIPEGQGAVKFSDVAAQIDATSVHFESLSDPIGTQVLEQNYEYDLVNPTKLLDKYLDIDPRIADRAHPNLTRPCLHRRGERRPERTGDEHVGREVRLTVGGVPVVARCVEQRSERGAGQRQHGAERDGGDHGG